MSGRCPRGRSTRSGPRPVRDGDGRRWCLLAGRPAFGTGGDVRGDARTERLGARGDVRGDAAADGRAHGHYIPMLGAVRVCRVRPEHSSRVPRTAAPELAARGVVGGDAARPACRAWRRIAATADPAGGWWLPFWLPPKGRRRGARRMVRAGEPPGQRGGSAGGHGFGSPRREPVAMPWPVVVPTSVVCSVVRSWFAPHRDRQGGTTRGCLCRRDRGALGVAWCSLGVSGVVTFVVRPVPTLQAMTLDRHSRWWGRPWGRSWGRSCSTVPVMTSSCGHGLGGRSC